MATLQQRKDEHKERNCLFCKMGDENSAEFNKRKGRTLWDFGACAFAILDISPKSLGHTLVISKTPYNDITDRLEEGKDQRVQVLEAAIRTASKLKKALEADKIYMMTICHHYEIWETRDGSTTEHLHFHLVPFHKGMGKMGEELLALDGERVDEAHLRELADLIKADTKN